MKSQEWERCTQLLLIVICESKANPSAEKTEILLEQNVKKKSRVKLHEIFQVIDKLFDKCFALKKMQLMRLVKQPMN